MGGWCSTRTTACGGGVYSGDIGICSGSSNNGEVCGGGRVAISMNMVVMGMSVEMVIVVVMIMMV